MIFGALSAIRTPTDIFPNIGIPVISAVWSYTGLSPDDMAGRIVAPYERALSTTVNDIEHIEFAVASRHRRRQDLLPAEREHQRRAGASHVDFANHSEAASPGGHAADHPGLQRLERSDHPVGAVERLALSDRALRSRPELHPAAAHHGRRRPASVRLWRRDAPGADRSRSERAARPQSLSDRCRRRARPAEPDHSGRHGENRALRIHRRPQRFAQGGRGLQQHAGQGGQRRRRVHARRRLRPRRFAAADQRRPARRAQGRADVRSQDRLGFHARHHLRHQGAPARRSRRRSLPASTLKFVADQSDFVKSSVTAVVREGLDRGLADRLHDPRVSRQLALDPDHHGVDPACGPEFPDRAFRCSARRSMS